ncbi:MaoC family dehydratase [Chelativorans sp. YIM 93263]|uniref:MaoC family dehydratase n=1 Tax=Chelativorans sp. YIM 93263 TaxID=2906648 RepID=UPI002378F778|nr:MaoC family dehydratase [Chelativorans sp. YIM 93263]
MTDKRESVETLRALVGEELGVSSWITIDQAMIDRFAETTNDHQWIHVDQERARRESPLGATIAHGYLTLSLISSLSYEIGAWPREIGTIINYGLDRVRFITPVKAGARVRLRSRLMSIDERSEAQFLVKTESTMEVEGEDKPAMIAETLVLFMPD